MKSSKFKKSISIALVLVSMISLCACGQQTKTKSDETKQKQEVVEPSKNEVINETTKEETVDILSFIQTNYSQSATTISENYNEPLYNLSKNHVFEFECSEEAGNMAFKAFKVFDNSNYEDLFNCSYAKVEYNNGKITVSPSGALFLNNTGSTNVNDGTWGSLNRLYLVQYIDLETGKDLEKPIVTPFTIEHEIDSPTISQTVDSNNSYILSWEEVPGAVQYRVYEHFGDVGYALECTTTETTVSVEEFKTQQKSETYMDLVYEDLKNAGYEIEKDGVVYMNRGVKYTDDFDGYFTVVAIDANGNQSGISNIVNVRDIANKLPYRIVDAVCKREIKNIEDVPTYVNVEMIDGSIKQMLINYHGAQTYRYTDDTNKMSIQAHVANTLFDNFLIVLTGKPYDDIMSEISYVTERQDSLNKSGGYEEPNVNIPNSPSKTETEEDEKAKEEIEKLDVEVKEPEEIKEVETTPEPTVEPTINETTPETSTPEPETTPEQAPATTEPTSNDLMAAAAREVSERLSGFDEDTLNQVLYANSDLEAWIALNLMAQMDLIVVPVSVFPETANIDYLTALLLEAYRQNPTSGMLCDARYSYEYEALCIEYVEDIDTRFEKAEKEYAKAKSLSESLVNSSMSDYEKIVAINDYFCTNASYDFDSMSTDVDLNSSLSESFIDAHTPYGILVNNYGVCESYSEAFALVGRMAGLDVIIETGYLQGGGHEWNRVCVDGQWCIIDVTNNDIDSCRNALLNVSEEQAKSMLTPDKIAFINYEAHRATDTTKEYYYKNNSFATSADEAVSMLIKQLENNKKASIRLPIGTSEEEAIEILQTVANKKRTNFKNIYFIADVLAAEAE